MFFIDEPSDRSKLISARAENEELHEQLAKANERVKELEELNLELAVNVEACCELTEMEMDAAIDRLLEIDNTEAKELVNKFALEQKIEGARCYARKLHSGGLIGVWDAFNSVCEQLSKGGESRCDHNFVSADNEHVIGAVICTKCHTVTERKGGES